MHRFSSLVRHRWYDCWLRLNELYTGQSIRKVLSLSFEAAAKDLFARVAKLRLLLNREII